MGVPKSVFDEFCRPLLIFGRLEKIFICHLLVYDKEKGGSKVKFTVQKPIILASGSPRRQELLTLAGIPFDVQVSHAEEDIELIEQDFGRYVEQLAVKKASVVAENHSEALVIAADTIVVYEGAIYPKPSSAEQAVAFLKEFSGNTHSVFTGVCLLEGGKSKLFSVETKVTFRSIDEALVHAYVLSGDPMDKAGGYGIQTAGALLVEKIDGDYLNVVGLPLSKLVELLRKEGHIRLKEGEHFLDS